MRTTDDFIKYLAKIRFENVFNPYAEICPTHDREDAAIIRRRNLHLVLESTLSKEIDSIWIARDLSHRGGRRTGLALTDERNLSSQAMLLGTPPLMKATKSENLNEQTAGVVWDMVRNINRPIFLWNVFPLHPFMRGNLLSNRKHTHREGRACSQFLVWLIDKLKPQTIVAIGNDAQKVLTGLDFCIKAVRHPSQGGRNEFIKQITSIYNPILR